MPNRKYPLPDLKLSRRADGWWIVGIPHWDPKDGIQGPYPRKKEAREERTILLRRMRRDNELCNPMGGYEWRAENLVRVWNVAEGDYKHYTQVLGGDRNDDKKRTRKISLERQSAFGLQVAPREWMQKSKAELAKLGIYGFPDAPKRKVTIVVSRKKKRRIKPQKLNGKVTIIIPKRKRKKKKEFSWADYGLTF